MSNTIIVKDQPKSGTLETLNIYVMGAKVFYPVVHAPKNKYQSTDREYSITVFIDEAAKDKLLDEVLVNKTFSQVGVCKTSKPPRRIKYPLSSQVEEGKVHYDEVDGLFGFNVTKAEFSKQGKPMTINVIDKDNKPFDENVGNGSVCNIKMFAYRNQDGQAVVMLDTVQVIEHVPYEAKEGGSGVVNDDVFGSYQIQQADAPAQKQDEAANTPVPKGKKQAPAAEDFDDSGLPF